MRRKNINEGLGTKIATGVIGGLTTLGGCSQLSNQESQEDFMAAAQQYAEAKVEQIEERDGELSPERYNDAIDFYYNQYIMQNESKRRFQKLIKESVRKSIMDLIA